ncbi:hypothetical protein CBOM_04421 [Ceraceosorus bombacis]|uniref:Uncharacterized protein n=1 Tax=Ceraceosorus bombacis TaxID=401625 RepID=A0A0P1BQD9_9BASI|nr:hypothetical protein CBOM_04421 [Ceraceosorus bombacis]
MISSAVVQDQLRLSRTEMDRAVANRAASSSASDSSTLTRRREARVDTTAASHATDAAQRNVGEATLVLGASGEATVVDAGTAAVDAADREPVPAPRTPSPSEARVAQLDRAIGFVCLLLAGLLVRRIF